MATIAPSPARNPKTMIAIQPAVVGWDDRRPPPVAGRRAAVCMRA
jgi:hypothetical protein